MKYCFTTTEFDTKEISDVCEMKIFPISGKFDL